VFEELMEALVGPWGIAGVLILGTKTGRKTLRNLFKAGISAGISIKETSEELCKKVENYERELVAEAKEEISPNHDGNDGKEIKTEHGRSDSASHH
jgi:hypothetical protein